MKDWREEFYDKFCFEDYAGTRWLIDGKDVYEKKLYTNKDQTTDIIDFINSLLTAQKEQFVREIEKSRVDDIGENGNYYGCEEHNAPYECCYNQALDRAIEIIKEAE